MRLFLNTVHVGPGCQQFPLFLMVSNNEDVDSSLDVSNGKQWKRIDEVQTRHFLCYRILSLKEAFLEIPYSDSWFVTACCQQHHIITIISHDQLFRMAIFNISQHVITLIDSFNLVCVVVNFHTTIPASSDQERVLFAVTYVTDLFGVLSIAIENEAGKNINAEDLTTNRTKK